MRESDIYDFKLILMVKVLSILSIDIQSDIYVSTFKCYTECLYFILDIPEDWTPTNECPVLCGGATTKLNGDSKEYQDEGGCNTQPCGGTCVIYSTYPVITRRYYPSAGSTPKIIMIYIYIYIYCYSVLTVIKN